MVFKFKFYSNENNELCHVHITKGSGNAKIWLEPKIKFAFSYNFTVREQREIETLTEQNYEILISKWYEYFGKN